MLHQHFLCWRAFIVSFGVFLLLQLIGRTTSPMASQITLWRLRRETRTLMSEQKVKTTGQN